MIKTVAFKITGVAPLLLHNGRLSNPLDPIVQELKKISSKRAKTDADYEEMSRLEWYGGLYLTDGKPCLPGEGIEAHLIDAAKKNKRGPSVRAGLFCDGDFPLIYEGPTDLEDLWKDENFRLVNAVRVQRNRVWRTRPMFKEWSCVIDVTFNDELLNESEIHHLFNIGGEQIGLFEWRPKFGRYYLDVL